MPQQLDELKLSLEKGERERLGADLLGKITAARNATRQMRDKVAAWNRFYESNLPEKTFPWKDCANLNIPVIQSFVDTYHASINDTLLSVDVIVGIEPPSSFSDPDLRRKAQALETMLQQYYSEEIDLARAVDQWNLLALKEPVAIQKIAWREEYRTVRRLQPVMEEFGPALDDQGIPKMRAVEVQEPKYRGPKLEIVDINNFVIYPTTAKSIEDAILVGDRYRLTLDQIKRRVKDGLFDRSALDLSSVSEATRVDDTELREQEDIEGIDRLAEFEEFWFWEVITGYDANGDGLAEDCVFTLEEQTGMLVRVTRFPYYHGRRYYVAQRLFPRPGRFFGRCAPQILEGCQREINSVHNQRSDATSLAISKVFKVLESWDGDPDAVTFHPGAVIRMNTPEEVQEFNINPIVPGMEIEQIDKDWAERSLAMSDLALGRETEKQKTLGEVQLVTAKAGVRFADLIRRAHQAIVELTEQVVGLMYQFMTDEEIAMRSGGKLAKNDLTVPWRFVPRGTLGAADKNYQQQSTLLLYDKLMQNPLVAGNPTYVYRLAQDLLLAFDRKDVESYIGTEEEMEQKMAGAQQLQEALGGGPLGLGAIGGMGNPPGRMGPGQGGAGGPGAGLPGPAL